MNRRTPEASGAFIVVSPYDLNEHWLCDFRADVVPLSQTCRDLRQAGVEWPLAKRTLSQYPRMYLRKLFPTVGRSDGVMVGIRAKLRQYASGSARARVTEAPKFGGTATSKISERLSDWSEARRLRRLALMRATCQGKHSFTGPKKLALVRLAREAEAEAEARGELVFVVMPVSPLYQANLLNPALTGDFEEALADLRRQFPQAKMVRLDRIAALGSDDLFSDLVHLNMYGQRIATAALLSELKGEGQFSQYRRAAGRP
jgi:hypothetical protein